MKSPRFPVAFALASACLVVSSPRAAAGCTLPRTDAEAFDDSGAVAEVEVLSAAPYELPGGAIRTRFELEVVRTFKGELPERLEIESPGGTLGGRTELRSDSLELAVGRSHILMLRRAADGGWLAAPHKVFRGVDARPALRRYFENRARGRRPATAEFPALETDAGPAGIPGSVVTPTGYSETGGQPTRFTRCDGGAPIQYLVDIAPAQLPSGMTQAAALEAVADALQAWAGASSLKFEFAGVTSFGNAASNISSQDSKLRIQLHDNYGTITNGSGTLGIGGGGFTPAASIFAGGKVGAQGFQERLYGYVVMENPANAASLNDASVFRRVLTHEIGHALGLAHSSENPSEPDPILKAATMYYNTGPGTTGATIQAYDVDRIQFGYPLANTPPYSIDRILPAVTTSPGYGTLPAVLGVNRIRLRVIDLQGTVPTPVLADNGGGEFSLSGNLLIYNPGGYVVAPRLSDPEIGGGTFYEKGIVQFSDGVNLSRAVRCSVIGYLGDSTPSDGLPDDWMIANFGTTAVGAPGSGRHPKDDPDGDGLENRLEFYLNTNPHNAASGPVKPVYDPATRRLSFTPVRFAPYAVESSTTLAPASWQLRRLETVFHVPATTFFDFSGDPHPPAEFYRVVVSP